MKSTKRLTTLTAIGIALSPFATQTFAGKITGVVMKPASSDGAPYATVQIFDDKDKSILGPGTTDKDGNYIFDSAEIRPGRKVVVKARWRKTESTPGHAPGEVKKDPEERNVLLLPPKKAGKADWVAAGKFLASTGAESFICSAGSYDDLNFVPASSIYHYVGSASKANNNTFPGARDLKIFTSKDQEAVAAAIEEAQKQFLAKKTLPSYEELRASSKGAIDRESHWEILAFLAPMQGSEKEWEKWKAAFDGSVDPQYTDDALKKAERVGKTVFKVEELGAREREYRGQKK